MKNKLRDPIVQSVIDKFEQRSNVGFKKYGKTLEDDIDDLETWIIHTQEELMDGVNYLEKMLKVVQEASKGPKCNCNTKPLEYKPPVLNKPTGPLGHEVITATMYPGDIKVDYTIVK